MICIPFTASGQPKWMFSSIINGENATTFMFGAGFVDQILSPAVIQKNKIKDVIIWEYKENYNSYALRKNEYDTNGYCIESILLPVNYNTKWRYDTMGNVIEEIDSTSKKLRSHSQFSYLWNEDENLVKRIAYVLLDSCLVCNYKMTNEIVADTCRTYCLTRVNHYTYDSLNNMRKLISDVYFPYASHEQLQFTYLYNSKGQLIVKKEYETWKYEYNRAGNIIRSERWDASGGRLYDYTLYKYDKKNRLISRMLKWSRNWKVEEFTYDENDLILNWNYLICENKNGRPHVTKFTRKLTYNYR